MEALLGSSQHFAFHPALNTIYRKRKQLCLQENGMRDKNMDIYEEQVLKSVSHGSGRVVLPGG
jgi:hypothetical protein